MNRKGMGPGPGLKWRSDFLLPASYLCDQSHKSLSQLPWAPVFSSVKGALPEKPCPLQHAMISNPRNSLL